MDLSAGRVLIGDEMGLGKTVQAIAAAVLLARHCGVERVLVICPVSLKHQWQEEFARFAGIQARTINGLRPARQDQYREADVCKITGYETLRRDADLIAAWQPDLVIVDESQRIKNWNTVTARALKRIASPYAVVLTGTPLENRLEELISIVQFVDQHRLGPTWRLLHEHQLHDEAGRVVGYRDLDRIGRSLAPILLRRRKAQVLEQLPERIDRTVYVPLTPQQQVHHDENDAIVKRIVQRWRKHGFLSDADQLRLRCALQNMRMVCNSTYLLDQSTDHGSKADEVIALLEDLFSDPDARVVLFSQWRRSHDILVPRLQAKGWGHVLFHGGVPGPKRGALIERFHQDPDCRVFLSTDAGGVGLNLQHAAATVINLDLPWNPAVLEQRIGRVHRLGQDRGVQIINYVSEGSIEQRMQATLAFKTSLFAGVLDDGEAEVFFDGSRLQQFMQGVEAATGAAEAVPTEAPARPPGPAATPPEPPVASPVGARAGVAKPDGRVATPASDPWGELLGAGLKLAESLLQTRDPAGGAGNGAAPGWIESDPDTGQQYLKLPVPEPDTLRRLTEVMGALAAGLRRD